MRWRYGAGVLLAVVALAGCGSGGSGGGHGGGSAQGPGPTQAGTATAATSAPAPAPPPVRPTTTPAASAAGASATPSAGGIAADLRACYDASCEITVSGPVTIPVDSRFGFSAFKVTRVGEDGVTIEANGGGTHLESGVGPGGTAALNGISVRVGSVHGDTADLSISHG